MAKTANEAILDATVRHQIKLLRFSDGQAAQAASILAESDAELVKLLETELTETSRARIDSMLAEVRRLRVATAERLAGELQGDLTGLVDIEADWENSMLQSATPVAVAFNTVPANVLKAVTSSPINGIPLEGWISRMTANDVSRIEQQINLGVLQGETIAQMTARLRGTRAGGYQDGVLSATRVEAEMIARTATNHVSNAARQATWDANSDIIRGLRWVSALDGRTSPVCQSRDGEVYDLDKGPRPPAHPNCRSTIAPVLYGEEIIGERAFVVDTRTRAKREIDFRAEAKQAVGADKWKAMTVGQRNDAIRARRIQWADTNIGQTPSKTNYQEWLKGQTAEFQDDVLGPGKAVLFRKGVTLDKFVDEQGKPYTLTQLQASLSGDKLNVLQPGVGLKAKSLLQQGLSPQDALAQVKLEFPDANTSLASMASYKSELKKAGALDLPGFTPPTGALKQAKAVAEVVDNFDSNLPANVKQAIGSQWASVVDELEGSPGAYGYYQAGKGVLLSGKKLSAVSSVQAQQIAAHELGHLLHKQHDLELPGEVLAAVKTSAKNLTPDARKLYSYYLSSPDELVAEIYAQALSPSMLTSQGLSALQFNSAFDSAIQAAKKAMTDKFPAPVIGVKTPLPGGPALPYEVAGKHTTVGTLSKALLQQGMPDDQVLAAVLAEFPNAKTKIASIQSYKSQLNKQGLLPNKASGPTIHAKPVAGATPTSVSPEVAAVAPESAAAAPFKGVLTASQLKEEALKLVAKGVISNSDIAETLKQNFPGNADGIKLNNIATWKSNWKKANPKQYAKAAGLADKASAELQSAGPITPPKLLNTPLGNLAQKALADVKSVLASGGTGKDAYTVMSNVFGSIKEPGASDLLELAQYQLAKAKASGKPYLSAAYKGPGAAQSNPAMDKYIASLDAKGTQALQAYVKAKSQGLGPVKTNQYVKAQAGYMPSASAKVKLKAAADYQLSLKGAGTVKTEAPSQASATFIPNAVSMQPARPASTPREGLPPPPRFTQAQQAAGIAKYYNRVSPSANTGINQQQRKLGLPELTPEEATAIRAYTGGVYRTLNNALRGGKYAGDPALQAYVEAAQNGLIKMPKYTGTSFRGLSLDPTGLKQMLSVYRSGAVVEDSAFVSSSYGGKAAFSGNVYMNIKSKTGVNISEFSNFRGEREVLYMPGTQFRILEVKQVNGTYVIEMEEI